MRVERPEHWEKPVGKLHSLTLFADGSAELAVEHRPGVIERMPVDRAAAAARLFEAIIRRLAED